MNTKSILNIVAFVLVIIGVLLKTNSKVGANIAIILAGATLLLGLFMFAFKDNKETGMTNGLNYLLVGTLAFLIVGAEFKGQHWTGWPLILGIAYILAFIVPIIFFSQKNDFKISKQFFISLYLFFILVLGLLPHNPISRTINNEWGDIEKTIIDSVQTNTNNK